MINKNSLQRIALFFLYSGLFYGVIFLGSSFIEKDKTINPEETTLELKSAPRSKIAQVSVAISTNVGIRYKERGVSSHDDIQATGLDDIKNVIGNNIEMNKSIFTTQNMLFVQEYLNLLKTDVVGLLNASSNRGKTLNDYISQLEVRFKSSQTNIAKLNNYKATLEAIMVDSDNKTNTLKTKISSDFSNFKDLETGANINEYLDLKNEYIYARTYLIFVNKILLQYDFLNSYNKNLLDALINNKDALTKKSFVVIPNNGEEFLKKLNLIFEEDAYKNELNKTE